MKTYFVYIISNRWNTTLYIGMTNNLFRRLSEHRNKVNEGFSKHYNLYKLLYYEEINDVLLAIAREKQLKRWRREKKMELIKQMNPEMKDLSEGWFDSQA